MARVEHTRPFADGAVQQSRGASRTAQNTLIAGNDREDPASPVCAPEARYRPTVINTELCGHFMRVLPFPLPYLGL